MNTRFAWAREEASRIYPSGPNEPTGRFVVLVDKFSFECNERAGLDAALSPRSESWETGARRRDAAYPQLHAVVVDGFQEVFFPQDCGDSRPVARRRGDLVWYSKETGP